MGETFLRFPCAVLCLSLAFAGLCDAEGVGGTLHGMTKSASGEPMPGVQVIAHNLEDKTELRTVSGLDGSYALSLEKPGRYEISAMCSAAKSASTNTTEVAPGQDRTYDIIMGTPAAKNAVPPAGFLSRLKKAYTDDWAGTASNGPTPAFRGYPAPVSNPPWPFVVWPYGGSPTIGQPNTMAPPLMTALYGGPHGEAWQASKIQMYGWVNGGFNISSSNKSGTANAPASYYVYPNSFQLDQATFYVEKVPDTVQTDHIDWGFRFTALYGMDYRFTTSKGVFSSQLLDKNSRYGFDPVMAYVDIYVPQIFEGTNIRIGRYVSLPDIEAQLAPNNYTYSHSITYTYDCYTQQGINTTTRINDHWMIQLGLSSGCDASLWTQDAKLTGNACVSYTWRTGKDNVYFCANSINSGKYAYNNLAAYYATWYHKINEKWHTDFESWYQYERQVPSIFGPIAPENGANGAWCKTGETRCFAPDSSLLNYVERQFGLHDTLSIRNEFVDDIKGQRTGIKTRYTEHLISWNHWIGTSLLFRPEVRFEHAYDNPAFDNGTKKSQLILAGDLIVFY
jgi:hypothetical protein